MKNFQFSIINYPLANPIHNIKLFDTTMIIQLQLSDKAYERLLASGSRLQGTIGLVNPNEGNFNEHARHASDGNGNYKYIRLRHGRASVNQKRVRLALNIALDEADITPADVLIAESRQASDFVDRVFDTDF
mgnify:FL=1